MAVSLHRGTRSRKRASGHVFIALGALLLVIFLLRSFASAPKPVWGTFSESAQDPQDDEDDNEDHIRPPLYPELRVAELALPQHNEDLPFPEGKNARFLRFSNQPPGAGLNNQLFEL
jgi:hypothetical protein